MKQESLKYLIEVFGKRYSEILGIDLSEGRDEEIFKWFFASLLFGAPMTEKAVVKTFKCFQKYKILTPKSTILTGWDRLVQILDEGSYTRYDFKTADKLLYVMSKLVENYDGSLTVLCDRASDAVDLEKRLKSLGKGIGDVTINIFLRELRDVWVKADPKPTALAVLAAENLGIIAKDAASGSALTQLRHFWFENKVCGKTFADFETALVRLGKDFCRKRKCAVCHFRGECLFLKAL